MKNVKVKIFNIINFIEIVSYCLVSTMEGIARIIYLIFFFAEICAQRCQQNEVYDYQRANACQLTCTNREQLMVKKCAKRAGCVCRGGFVRDPITMECITWDKCPIVCPNDEIYSECSGGCQPDCSSLYDPFNCAMICEPGCNCPKEFVRDRNGKCIPKSKCPKCGQNETYSSCAPPAFCQKSCVNKDKICPLDCFDGCICKEKFVRLLSVKSICIPENQCPK